MPGLLTEQPIENRKSKIENPQLAFSVALGSLQRLSEQAVETLQSLMHDPQVSPSVRLSAARTVLQMSFKAAQQFTLQSRVDQLETAATALQSDPQENTPLPLSQSTIENQKSKIENRNGREEDPALNRSDSAKSTHLPADIPPLPPGVVGQASVPVEAGEQEGDAGINRSNPLHSDHLAANRSPLPPNLGGRGGGEGLGEESGQDSFCLSLLHALAAIKKPNSV